VRSGRPEWPPKPSWGLARAECPLARRTEPGFRSSRVGTAYVNRSATGFYEAPKCICLGGMKALTIAATTEAPSVLLRS